MSTDIRHFRTEYSDRAIHGLAAALVDAQVDLNPHQVDTALFTFTSPFSTGALLADEVGLGKTIEAGLVLSQKWAERKRRILVVTPSNLRKQWHQELTEKFFLPCRLLESKSYNAAVKEGKFRPFEGEEIVICSYQFAKNKADDVQAVRWDLVVIDEAHRLRNVYKPSNVIARTLKMALAGKDKLLLTAPPLQNSQRLPLVQEFTPEEIEDLEAFIELALSIDHNAKGRSMLTALEVAEGIVLFNGSNTDERSKQIYFLNRKNAADRRVFELLSEKFRLFEGVFGASDEVLGAIESGVDFEKRIAVLDSFAGSGTTGAVAHKMGRRLIMVELGEHCHTHIIPRLKKVIDGEDPGGITKAVNWKGGGGFRYYRLAPSLLAKDRWGNWVINKSVRFWCFAPLFEAKMSIAT